MNSKIRPMTFAAVVLLGALSAPKTWAQAVTYDGCKDIRDIPVASVVNYSLGDIAAAAIAPNGAPIIYYNPRVLASTRWQTRLFFYAHECGHHALGHTLQGLRLGQEQEADCWGIETLYRANLLTDADVAMIQLDLSSFGRGDWTHLPGPMRAVNLRRCLGTTSSGSSSDETQSERAGSSGNFSNVLREVLDSTSRGFRNLRGSPDPDAGGEAWNAKVALPDAVECDVWVYRDRSLGQRYDCDMARETD